MKISSTQKIGPVPLSDGGFPTVMDAVAALSTSDKLGRLATIAQRRLDRLAACPTGQRLRGLRDPMEFVNEAISLLLQEVDGPGTGRRTHPRHLGSMCSFFNFVQSVVQSCISNWFKQLRRQGEHLPIDLPAGEGPHIEPAAPNDVVRELALKDTTTELLSRLKEHFENRPEIRAAVVDLEENGLDGNRLPRNLQTDKHMHRLRIKARQVLKEMSRREGVNDPTGAELFGP